MTADDHAEEILRPPVAGAHARASLKVEIDPIRETLDVVLVATNRVKGTSGRPSGGRYT